MGKRTEWMSPCLKQLLCTLSFLANGSYQKIIAKNIDTYVSQSSACRAIHQVVDALNNINIVNKYIRFPQNHNERQVLKERFYEKFKIPGVLGCIDGTLVSMIRPKQHEERYYCRKGYHARNVLICFVTAGVSLNMASSGLVMGFTSGLLQQLKEPHSEIPIDEDSGSWIAAIPGFSLIVGNIIIPTIMANYGRKKANLLSIVPLLTGWACIILAKGIPLLLIARFLQGVSMGMSSLISSTLIGEYTSPKNRGAFLMTISISIALAVLSVHTIGSYLSWQMTAIICGVVAAIDLVIVILSPESPSWLSDQGRYEECRTVFRWLRGSGEEEELKRMVEASIIVREAKADVKTNQSIIRKIIVNLAYFNSTIKKKEFYKPIFIMMHIYTLGQWSGLNLLVAYPYDLFAKVVGPDANIPLLVVTVDAHRLIANILAMYIVKKVKRRTMLFTTVSINIFGLFATAAYTFLRSRDEFHIDEPIIGIILIHIIMFAIATGTLPLCFIIAGEIFPLEYRSLAGGISVIFFSTHLFITVKTVPYFFSTLGLYGAFCLYALVLIYCSLITWWFLPETKDRTLQDIEDEFRGRALSPQELKSVQSLNSWKSAHGDRRCSTPVIVT